MGFENIGYRPSRIEAESKIEKEDKIYHEIAKISLLYAVKKYKQEKEKNVDYKMSSAIKEFTPAEGVILSPVFNSEEYGSLSQEEQSKLFSSDFFNKIDSLIEEGVYDFDEALVLLDEAINKTKEKVEVGKKSENGEDESPIKTKVLKFNMADDYSNSVNERYPEMEKIGFFKYDKYLEVHAKYFFENEEEKLSEGMIISDLNKIAEYIVDKEPATAAVIGRSWLLDTPVARNLGFIKIEDQESKQNDLSAWLQFVDKDGQISKKRFEKFLEKGELPFKSVKSYIPVEDFLRQYLPRERKGKIVLKEIDEEKFSFWEKRIKSAKSFKNNWNASIKEGIDFDLFLEKNPIADYISPLSEEEQQEIILHFKNLYNAKTLNADISKHSDQRLKELGAKINDYYKQYYKDKEVVIE